jgi:hypothetical protein
MNDTRKGMGRLQAVGLVAGGALVGAVLIGATAANAATSTPSPSTTSGSTTTPTAPRAFDHGGATPVRSDEKAASTALSAAAVSVAVPGATVYRVETDAGDAAYEVHLTKADGSLATVKFDKNLAVLRVESGMGQGDPGPAGAPMGASAHGQPA